MDPTNISRTCTKALSDANVNSNGTPTGITSGCMKFYIYDNSGGNYKLILDHNTSGNVAWINQADYLAAGGTQTDWDAAKYNLMGPITANKRLIDDTAGWIGGPRMMTADEVAHIVGADLETTIKWKSTLPIGTTVGSQATWFYLDGGRNSAPTSYSSTNGWQYKNATSTGTSKYAWLFDYTDSCTTSGCNYIDNNTYPTPDKTSTSQRSVTGYLLSSTVNNSKYNSNWRVNNKGKLADVRSDELAHGIRPVIEVPKSYID